MSKRKPRCSKRTKKICADNHCHWCGDVGFCQPKSKPCPSKMKGRINTWHMYLQTEDAQKHRTMKAKARAYKKWMAKQNPFSLQSGITISGWKFKGGRYYYYH